MTEGLWERASWRRMAIALYLTFAILSTATYALSAVFFGSASQIPFFPPQF